MTRTLLFVTVGAFLLQLVLGRLMADLFALWPLSAGFMPWQLVTYAFLHGGLTHLLFNMFGLWMFGGEMERLWGPRRFLTFYLVSALSGGLVQFLIKSSAGSPYPTVGASGAVFGLLLAYAMYFPHRRVLLLFPPIPMPAWLFASGYAAIELVLGITGTADGVAHFAHLGGMVGGYLMIRYWRGQPPFSVGR